RGCHQHGVWGGYSRRMTLVENSIEETLGGAITVEHGQDFRIADNVLHDNQIAVELYWDEDPELVKGPFGKHFDTSSGGHAVLRNSFSGNDSDFVVMSTARLRVAGNVFAARGRELTVTSVRSIDGAALETSAVRALLTGIGGWSASGRLKEVSIAAASAEAGDSDPDAALDNEPPQAPGVQRAFDPDKQDGEGLETIVMGEWGPWDFRAGEAKPVQRPPGGLLAGAEWDAAWFSWKDGADPRGDAQALAAWRDLAKTPLVSARVAAWSTPFAADPKIQAQVGENHFGLIAKSAVKLEQGRYRLAVVSDDGVRVLIDGTPVLENWTWHAPTRDAVELELGAGQHAFELEYFQIDGASALSMDLERLP
ncbi:MAG: PA14 domain-containing protein, partial [Planctomycetota bacterium]